MKNSLFRKTCKDEIKALFSISCVVFHEVKAFAVIFFSNFTQIE